MIEHITNEEIDFLECWSNPICLAETLFSNFDNLTEFSDNFGELRVYQYPMLSYEPIIDENVKDLSLKERFELRKGAGDLYNYGARKFGKSLITEKLDIPISMLHDDNYWTGFSSADAIHLQDILDVVIRAIDSHPILHMWYRRKRGAPKYEVEGRNGWILQGINMNVQAKDPGKQFFGKHVKKLWIEEASLEVDKSYDKRKDSLSELGAIFRFSGMTNFTRHTPAGKAFYDPENRQKILNLPQFVNPMFDEKEDKSRQKEYGGKDTLSYRVFVEGEVVEDGLSEFDISRIEPFINSKVEIKVFEVKKDSFEYFKNLIVVERPKNIQRIFIAGDIGDGSGGSELVVLGEIGDKYQYLYRIALYSLKDDEQFEIVDWLIQKLEANVVAIDCGDGTGRAIYRRLEKKYGTENLVRYFGGDKVGVDFKKDENSGKYILENGKPIFVEEFMSEWSVRWLKHLLYEGKISLPTDYKFEKQINSVMSRTVGTRTVYACVSEDGDHVFDAWKVFAIAQWLKKAFNKTPKMTTESGVGVSSWSVKKEIDPKFKEAIEKRIQIECSEEEFKKVLKAHLTNAGMKASVEDKQELAKYLSDELNRLTKLFNT